MHSSTTWTTCASPTPGTESADESPFIDHGSCAFHLARGHDQWLALPGIDHVVVSAEGRITLLRRTMRRPERVASLERRHRTGLSLAHGRTRIRNRSMTVGKTVGGQVLDPSARLSLRAPNGARVTTKIGRTPRTDFFREDAINEGLRAPNRYYKLGR